MGHSTDQPTLEGEQLTLRPLADADIDSLTQTFGCESTLEDDPSLPPLWDLVNSVGYLENVRDAYQLGTGIAFAIEKDGVFAGVISLFAFRGFAGEIGYTIHPRYRRKGIATAAVKLLADFGFRTMHLHRIEAVCLERHTGSRRVVEKAGFQFEGIARGRYFDRKIDAHANAAIYAKLSTD